MDKYLNVFYDPKIKPKTEYPTLLVQYLAHRFDLLPGGKILDVGCGRGDVLEAFVKAGFEAHGLDLKPYGELAPKGTELKYANFETEKFPYDDDSFDVVFSKSVIEHLHKPDNYLKEINRILKPGGRVIILTPDWQTQRYVFYNDHTHVQPYIVSGLAKALRLYEYHQITAELFYQLPSVWKYSALKILLRPLQLLFPVKQVKKSSYWRWSRELMILGVGVK